VRGAEWAATVKDLRLPRDSAKRALLLALIPGMGAVYNEQYFKAVTYLVVFSTLCVAGDVHPIFGFAAFVFYVFMLFDAYRSAEEIQHLRVKEGGSVSPRPADVTSPVWGALLIVLGLFLTLINFDVISVERFRKLWPVGVILLGLFLVYRSLTGDKTHSSDMDMTERRHNQL
jgi:hypothetical protein